MIPPCFKDLDIPMLGISPISAFPAPDFFPVPAPRFLPSPLWIYFIAQGSICFQESPVEKMLSKAGTKLFIIINIQMRFFLLDQPLETLFPTEKKPPSADVLNELATVWGIMVFFNFRSHKIIKVL